MKKALVILLSVLIVAVSSDISLAEQKVIKDAAEYNAYISALNTNDPLQKAAAMEAFVVKYPHSVVVIDALEQAMAAYQQTGNREKVEQKADEILRLMPDNVRALAIVTFLQRMKGTQGDLDLVHKAASNGEKGLNALRNWTKPEGVSDADYEKLSAQMTEIFAGAIAFDALQKKDYARARTYYLKSVNIDPSNLQDVYQLGIADLQMTPMDVAGFWYIAKAISLAQAQNNASAARGIEQYGKAKYKRYHGSEEGWNELLAAAKVQTSPPAGFNLKAAPTECELAVQAVEKYDPSSLSFSDWEFILAHRDCSVEGGNAARKVWQAIQDKQKQGAAKLKIPVKVISVSGNLIYAAITDENRQANKADLEIVLEKPALQPISAGSEIHAIGVLTGYSLNPFIFKMINAEVQ